MGKRLCLTFSVYYFVHPYNITALMICQHVFLNIYIFYRKIVTENGVNSNESSVFSLLYIQYFLHIRAIIKVSQQFITTQPLHEMADWQTITYILSFLIFIFWCIRSFVTEAVCRRRRILFAGFSLVWLVDYHSVELSSEAGDFIRSMSVKCTI